MTAAWRTAIAQARVKGVVGGAWREGEWEEGGGRWEGEGEEVTGRGLLKRERFGRAWEEVGPGTWILLLGLRGRAGGEKDRDVAGLMEGLEGGTRGLFLCRRSLRLGLRRGEVRVGVSEAGGGCWAWDRLG